MSETIDKIHDLEFSDQQIKLRQLVEAEVVSIMYENLTEKLISKVHFLTVENKLNHVINSMT